MRLANLGMIAAMAPLVSTLPAHAVEHAQSADVIVYGGTASGLIAAYAAARDGSKVVLLEPGRTWAEWLPVVYRRQMLATPL